MLQRFQIRTPQLSPLQPVNHQVNLVFSTVLCPSTYLWLVSI